jgi:hypothetical protein
VAPRRLHSPLTSILRIDDRFGLNIDFAFTFAHLAGVVPPAAGRPES